MDLTQLKTELGAYFRQNNKEIRAMVYKGATIIQYLKKVTKVKGQYPTFHSVIGHVVQGFQPVWNEIGDFKIKANILIAYHQKVNFPIIPSEIEGTWLADLNDKNMLPSARPISQFIMEESLKPKVIADIGELMISGVYDAGDLATFGKSMNGLLVILNNGINSTDQPMYRMRLSTTPTEANIVDLILEFEKKIPRSVKRYLTKIYMDETWADAYRLKYEELYGTHALMKADDVLKSRLNKLKIVGLDMPGSNIIFTTPDENFIMVTDDLDGNGPKVTDIQIQDYKVKVFMEWWMGIQFWTNQLVFVSVYSGSGSGLAAGNDNGEYYSG